MKKGKSVGEKKKNSSEFSMKAPLALLAVVALMVVVVIFTVNYGKPTAKDLLLSIKLPEIPKQLTEENVRTFLSTERSFTINGDIDMHLVATDNSLTQDITYKIPITVTLDIYQMEDGRNAISAGSYMDIAVLNPYSEDLEGEYEKDYFFIVNDSLADADVYMREYDTLTSDIELIDETESTGGNWMFYNDRDINLQGFMDAYNADHADSPDNYEALQSAFEKLGKMIAKKAKVKEEDHNGTKTYVLTASIDFANEKNNSTGQQVMQFLQAYNDTFKYLNLSDFLKYYGKYVVADISMYFVENGDSYSLLSVQVDFSKSRLEKYFLDRYKNVLKDKTDKITVDIDKLAFEFIVLPAVPEEVKAIGANLDVYTTERMEEELHDHEHEEESSTTDGSDGEEIGG